MKKVTVLSAFPKLISEALEYGILKRASNSVEINSLDLRDWGEGNYQKIDDTTFASGPGMLFRPDVLASAVKDIDENKDAYIIHVSPRGVPLTSKKVKKLAEKDNIIIIASRYEGVDQRFLDNYVHEEISIGDYVLTGGELASLVLIDSMLRMSGEILKTDAVENESFEQGLLEYPHYTKPTIFENQEVPKYLRNGNHQEINEERFNQQLLITWQRRPDLLREYPLCQVTVGSNSPLTKIKKQNLLLKKRLAAFEKVIQEYKRCPKKM